MFDRAAQIAVSSKKPEQCKENKFSTQSISELKNKHSKIDYINRNIHCCILKGKMQVPEYFFTMYIWQHEAL